MRKKLKRRKANRAKSKLGLPDLEYAKSAVLASLRSPESQRSYRRSIEDFVGWYCSEPRLSFNKTVVTRCRIHLEEKLLASASINVRLAAVRRLAYEAADTGLLSPDLAAGIRRVKGAKKLGMRLGNWLSAAQIRHGRLFRCVCRRGMGWGTKIRKKVVWHIVKAYAGQLGTSPGCSQ